MPSGYNACVFTLLIPPAILSLINARTTVIPLFSGVVDGVWQLQLTTWAEHQWRSSQKCRWEEVSEGAGSMKYKWQHRDGWKYEHEGSGEIDDGTYSVLCEPFLPLDVE